MEGGVPRSLLDRGYLAGLVGVLTLEAAGVAIQVVTGVPVPVITVVAAAFVVACMLRVHGLWGTMAFVALVVAIPFGSEFLGVLTGFPYGAYAYTARMGPRVSGLVPVFILIAWLNIAYMAIATTTIAVGRSRLWLAPVDALVAIGYDVIVDPLAVRAGYWSWQGTPLLYGVPLSNFLGWFLVVTLLSLAARAVWARDSRAPAKMPRTLAWVVPALLLGSALDFGVLAVSAGLPIAAIAGNAILLPAVAAAWTHLARTAADRPAPNPWSRPRPGPAGERA